MNDIEDIINYFTGVIEIHGDDNDKKYWNTVLKERQSDKDRIKDLEEINEAHKKENGELREREKDLQKSVDQIYDDYQDIGKMYFNLTEKIESKIEELKQEDLKIYDTDSEDVRIAKYEQRAVLQVLEELLKGE